MCYLIDDDIFLLKYVFVRCDTVSENNYGPWKDGYKFFGLNYQKLRLSFSLNTFWLINAGIDMVSSGINDRAYGDGTHCIIFGYNVEYGHINDGFIYCIGKGLCTGYAHAQSCI